MPDPLVSLSGWGPGWYWKKEEAIVHLWLENLLYFEFLLYKSYQKAIGLPKSKSKEKGGFLEKV